MSIKIKNKDEINKIKNCGSIIAEVQKILIDLIKPGISTLELDKMAENYTLSKGFIPAFKGYQEFPGSICASINNEVVHGIPLKNKVLEEGDIISIDFGVFKDEFYADAAFTFPVGDIDNYTRKLLEVTQGSLYEGIGKLKPGNKLFDISKSIQDFVESNGFSVVRTYVGHGIGRDLHEDPQIPNFVDENDTRDSSIDLIEGMVLAIEPMVNMGSYEVALSEDNWTVLTKDGTLSAHFEHTVAITADGPLILTN
ncbi:MAG: type I methionyl aminopeptidase [Thermodesulfobacteriota bacterium]|nr:type I methionyl aminopeptidase [Thermodesulfobacteriota bacterium]